MTLTAKRNKAAAERIDDLIYTGIANAGGSIKRPVLTRQVAEGIPGTSQTTDHRMLRVFERLQELERLGRIARDRGTRMISKI